MVVEEEDATSREWKVGDKGGGGGGGGWETSGGQRKRSSQA